MLVRFELEHAEGHPADLFAVLVAEHVARVDEVADAESRGFLLRNGFDHRAHRHAVSGVQVTRVTLFAVGGDDADVAVVGEQLMQFGLFVRLHFRRVGHFNAAQHPRLQHGRRRNDTAVHRGGRGFRIAVRRVEVPHGVAPLPDHGFVDGVAGLLRRPDLDAGVGLHRLFEFLFGHLGHKNAPESWLVARRFSLSRSSAEMPMTWRSSEDDENGLPSPARLLSVGEGAGEGDPARRIFEREGRGEGSTKRGPGRPNCRNRRKGKAA